MGFARKLQASGSDIVFEEDLAILFRPFRIDSRMKSTFETVVEESELSRPGPIVAHFKSSPQQVFGLST